MNHHVLKILFSLKHRTIVLNVIRIKGRKIMEKITSGKLAKMAGHVDGLTLGKGMIIKLPEIK